MKGTTIVNTTVWLRAVLFLVCLAAFRPQESSQQTSVRDLAERFCKMDAEGKRLRPDGQKEILPLLYEHKPLAEYLEITVVKDYIVHSRDVHGDGAQVDVDYAVWGKLDSSFHFVRLAGLSENHPIQIWEYVSMIQSDKYLEPRGDGQWQELRDSLQWRIKMYPSSPHVSVSAAMRYVREEGYQSRDPVIKRNAQVAVADLSGLLNASFAQSREPQQSPSAVLAQFVALQTEGKGLTAEGQKELDALLLQPAAWRNEKIHVTRDFRVSNALLTGNRGDLYVEYIALGDLDSSLRFANGVPGGVKVRQGYTFVLSNKYSLPGRGGKPAQEFVGPNRWKIADLPPEQWLTLNAAIRYVTDMRDKTVDPAIKQNAKRTLVDLRTLQ